MALMRAARPTGAPMRETVGRAVRIAPGHWQALLALDNQLRHAKSQKERKVRTEARCLEKCSS